MKVYIAIGYYSEEEYKKISGALDVRMMDYNEDTDVYRYLYGFTTDKKLFDEFSKFHTNFRTKVVKMNKEEYRDFRRDNKSSEISFYPVIYDIKADSSTEVKNLTIVLPITKNEYVNSSDYCQELYFDDIASMASIDPYIFKSKYQTYLENISYTSAYVDFYGSDELREWFDYNSSYHPDIKFNEVGFLSLLYDTMINVPKLHKYIIERMDDER